MLNSKQSYLLTQLVLFIIWPFGSFLLAVRFFRNRISWLFYMLFACVAGMNFYYTYHFDIYRNVELFKEFTAYSNDFIVSGNFLSLHPEMGVDVYGQLVFILSSRITSNPKIFTLIITLLYTYFFGRVAVELIKDIKGHTTQLMLIYFFGFVIFFSFLNIGGIRQGAAYFYYIFHIIRYFKGGRHSKYLIFLTPFFHFGMIIPCLLFVVYLILKERERVAYYFLAISFFGESIYRYVTKLVYQLPFLSKSLNFRVKNYIGEYVELRDTAVSGYLRFKEPFFLIMMAIVIILLRYFYGNNFNAFTKRFYIFMIWLLGLVNILSVNIMLFQRNAVLWILLAFIYMFYFVMEFKGQKLVKKISLVPVLPIIINSAMTLLEGCKFVSIESIVGNLYYLVFESEPTNSVYYIIYEFLH